jgi:hypothetical protein
LERAVLRTLCCLVFSIAELSGRGFIAGMVRSGGVPGGDAGDGVVGCGLRMNGSTIWIVGFERGVSAGDRFAVWYKHGVFGFECRWSWATGYNLDWCDCLFR